MKDTKLLQTNDAMVWAEEFVRIKKEQAWNLEDIEEGLMVAWFANAMVAQDMATNRTVLITKEISIGDEEVYCEWFTCPECHKNQIFEDCKYCPDCGVELRWAKDAIAV